MGVATRVNGAAPPFVPLEEIGLASWDFWAQDDDFRDGAFATLRREAPIAFHQELAQEGLVSGHGTTSIALGALMIWAQPVNRGGGVRVRSIA
jgi:methyl-branched lipid omega-hydroxylase